VTQPAETGTWSGRGLWRYRTELSIRGDPVTLGEGATPILPYEKFLLKLEGISPTGSFKDRGAATAITAARAAGARTVIEDSSGNAGTAIAALRKAEERLGREVNVTAYSPEEFREKIKSRDHFLAAVLRGRKQFLKGGQSDLDELAGK